MLDQIDEKMYAKEFEDSYDQVNCYGIAFFKKNGYEKLLPAAYRKLCDACITFYFRCTEQVKDAEELKKELRKRLEAYRVDGAAWIAALPLKTRMGYELFSMSPGLYAKMLQKMQEAS